jgi:hypothetical protein
MRVVQGRAVEQAAFFTGAKGFYCSVMPYKDSLDWLKTLQPSENTANLHCTVMYSKDLVDNHIGALERCGFGPEDVFGATPKSVEFWDGHDGRGVLVLTLDSRDLEEAHAKMREFGIKPTFDPYVPHVTLVSGTENNPKWIRRMNDSMDKNKMLYFCGLKIEDLS